MPTYGEKKKKDIIESVLPATRRGARNARREFRQINRQERRHVSNALASLYHRGAAGDEIVDTYDADPFDYQFTLDIDKRYARGDRRDYDNLNSLFRWAPTQVKDVRVQDRLTYIKAMLPDNVIGRHAAGHVENLDEFYVDHDADYRHNRRTAEDREADRWIEYAEWHNRLVILCENGKLGWFNDQKMALKAVREDIDFDEVQMLRRQRAAQQVFYDRSTDSYYRKRYEFRPLCGHKDIPDFIRETFIHYPYFLPQGEVNMRDMIRRLTM